MFAFPTQCRKGVDRLPYVDSTLKYKYNRRFPFFQPVETSVLFLSGGQFARERLYCQIENAPPWFARQKGYSVENFTILLKKYADFIVRVGVNPQPGQTLVINCCLEAAPLARLCVRSAYEAGARDVLVNWSDNDVSRSRMELGSEEALSDFKSWQLRRYLDYAESEGGVCVLHILADDPEVYAGLDGAKISRVNAGQRKFMAPWREYTMNDRVQWSIAAMPSAPWAKKMFPELDEAAAIEKLWQLIFDVCRVTGGDPVNEWKAHLDRLTALGEKMNAFDLESVHFQSSNGTDLTVGIADKALWESAGSKNEKGVFFLPNIPTEEVFTAPHKEKVNGIVYGTKPYVFNGQLIKGFHVTFKDGKVVEHGAEEGAELLGQLLSTDEGACHIGEVALVPASSPINRSGALFYNTLFDENAACHIAFGASYPGTTRNGTTLSKEELLAFEKDILGVYISGHPFDDYEGLWRKNITATSADFIVDEETEEAVVKDGMKVVIGGLVAGKVVKTTRSNQLMAFITLEDLMGSVEVIVFPKNYEADRDVLTEDSKIFIKGRVSLGDEPVGKLVCEQVIPFSKVPRQLWLQFEDKEIYQAMEGEILGILKESEGPDSVVIYLKKERAKKILPANWKVEAAGELMETLICKLGEKNVKLVEKNLINLGK
mgnify:CR=1 FL=1